MKNEAKDEVTKNATSYQALVKNILKQEVVRKNITFNFQMLFKLNDL